MTLRGATSIAVVLGALAVAACGSAPPPASPCQLRAARTTPAGAPEPTGAMFRELVLASGQRPASCDGRAIEPDVGCAAARTAWTVLPEPEVRIRRRIDEHWHLVWVVTMTSAAGEGLGPMALVAQTPSGLHVRAAGIVRAAGERPSAERYRVGDRSVWLVSGDRCGEGGCARVASLYEMRGQSLVPLPWAGGPWCPASLELHATASAPEAREAIATTAVEPVAEGLALVETVVIQEQRAAGLPPTVVHEASARRLLRLEPEGLRVAEAPLSSRFRGPSGRNLEFTRN